jgi:hypothetical protein
MQADTAGCYRQGIWQGFSIQVFIVNLRLQLRKKAVPLDPAAVQQAILRGYQPSEKMRSEEWFNEINSK